MPFADWGRGIGTGPGGAGSSLLLGAGGLGWADSEDAVTQGAGD